MADLNQSALAFSAIFANKGSSVFSTAARPNDPNRVANALLHDIERKEHRIDDIDIIHETLEYRLNHLGEEEEDEEEEPVSSYNSERDNEEDDDSDSLSRSLDDRDGEEDEEEVEEMNVDFFNKIDVTKGRGTGSKTTATLRKAHMVTDKAAHDYLDNKERDLVHSKKISDEMQKEWNHNRDVFYLFVSQRHEEFKETSDKIDDLLTRIEEDTIKLNERQEALDQQDASLKEEKRLFDVQQLLFKAREATFKEEQRLFDERCASVTPRETSLKEDQRLFDEKRVSVTVAETTLKEERSLLNEHRASFDEREKKAIQEIKGREESLRLKTKELDDKALRLQQQEVVQQKTIQEYEYKNKLIIEEMSKIGQQNALMLHEAQQNERNRLKEEDICNMVIEGKFMMMKGKELDRFIPTSVSPMELSMLMTTTNTDVLSFKNEEYVVIIVKERDSPRIVFKQVISRRLVTL